MRSKDGMSVDEEEAPSTSVVMGGVSNDQTTNCNYNTLETIIPVQDGDFNLSNGDLDNLRLLDEALEADDQTEFTAKPPLIQRVPSRLLLGKKKDFNKYFKPKVIAIGPFHHDDPNLQEAEKLKLELAAHFIKKVGVQKEILYSKIKTEIAKLKKCYDPKELEPYFNDNEKLTWMFFLDGCAVLQAIFLNYGRNGRDDEADASNQLNIKNDLLTFIYLDFFLLENQLPYQVLELLTCLNDQGRKFKESVKRFIDDNVMTPAEMKKEQQRCLQQQDKRKQQQQQQNQRKQKQKQQQEREPAHLLELLRTRLLVTPEEKKSACNWIFRYITQYNQKRMGSHHSHTFRNIKELRQAGIWLRPSETSSLKDISFNRICFVGNLRLPPISVDDKTGPKFMNLIAYEMCPDFDNDFAVTSYIWFLDSLVDEAQDVKALRDAGILYNGLGSDEEAAKLFNKMNTNLVPSPIIYHEVKTKIQNHCRNMWITNAAQAYHTHFSSPWTFVAFVGAIGALFLSALQTYYTIHQNK